MRTGGDQEEDHLLKKGELYRYLIIERLEIESDIAYNFIECEYDDYTRTITEQNDDDPRDPCLLLSHI